MKSKFKAIPVVKNPLMHRFEMRIGEHLAYIDYKEKKVKLWLIHTTYPEVYKADGVIPAIIEKTLRDAEQSNLKVIPICPEIVKYIAAHPAWKRVVFAGKDELTEEH
ncbi:hypothetical protein LX64_03394 [Chitinophaga skermanii]|uniref:N-acetyltransferase domain-containing protein n=1 Tax=Chitinophaga skermanii TaxID=331697 RepID=A0A327QFI9_9BACT|nr:GNAT family N-acetyltransferase [Chitinophaga skermanii]RAJ02382.1 hypothetical protein LX64_03394 [Chitinophaga skermanii]